MRTFESLNTDLDPREPTEDPQSSGSLGTAVNPNRQRSPLPKSTCAVTVLDPEQNPADVLPDLDEHGIWIEDEREKDEPWRSRYCVTRCTGADLIDGVEVRCDAKVRGSDRCKNHKRFCKGRTIKNEPCGAPPLREPGTNRDIGYCRAHASDEERERIADLHMEIQEKLGVEVQIVHGERFGNLEEVQAAGKAGGLARRYPRLSEKMAVALEEHAEEIVEAGIEQLQATKAVVLEESGTDDAGNRWTRQWVEESPDGFVRLKAHESLTNRAFGRPHQAVDITEDKRQLNLTIDARDPETRKHLHEFLRSRPTVDA